MNKKETNMAAPDREIIETATTEQSPVTDISIAEYDEMIVNFCISLTPKSTTLASHLLQAVNGISFHDDSVHIKAESMKHMEYLAALPVNKYKKLLEAYQVVTSKQTSPSPSIDYVFKEVKRYREFWDKNGGIPEWIIDGFRANA